MAKIYFIDLPLQTEFEYVRQGRSYTAIKIASDSWKVIRGGNNRGDISGWTEEPRTVTRIINSPTKGPHQMFKDLLGSLKTYLNENRDLIFTVGLVLLLDEYAFNGVFRDRLKNLVEGFLSKAEAKHASGGTTIDTKAS